MFSAVCCADSVLCLKLLPPDDAQCFAATVLV